MKQRSRNQRVEEGFLSRKGMKVDLEAREGGRQSMYLYQYMQ